jgi:hypothetical protein
MLLRFTSQDLFESVLVDVATCQPAFHLSTTVVAGPSAGPVRRQTEIRDGAGAIVGTIGWVGRVPQSITLLDESVGGLVDLFASSTIQFMFVSFPKEIFNTSQCALQP